MGQDLPTTTRRAGRWTGGAITRSLSAAPLRAGAAGAGEQESDCLRDRRAEATALVAAAPAPAGSTAGITSDDVLNHVVAPIIYLAILLPWTLTDTTAADLVDTLLRGTPTQ